MEKKRLLQARSPVFFFDDNLPVKKSVLSRRRRYPEENAIILVRYLGQQGRCRRSLGLRGSRCIGSLTRRRVCWQRGVCRLAFMSGKVTFRIVNYRASSQSVLASAFFRRSIRRLPFGTSDIVFSASAKSFSMPIAVFSSSSKFDCRLHFLQFPVTGDWFVIFGFLIGGDYAFIVSQHSLVR